MDNRINLFDWGLDQERQDVFEEQFSNYKLGRVVEEHKNLYRVITGEGYIIGKVAGKFIYKATDNTQYPSVGDWVILDMDKDAKGKAFIIHVMDRKSKFSRKIAGNTFEEQVVVANIDRIFICMSLNKDFNLKRLDRYTALAWDSGAMPVILLTKADLCLDVDEIYDKIAQTVIGIPIIIISMVDHRGIDEIKEYISYGKTTALIGSSGVGKSTLINRLIGNEVQHTQQIMDDDRGKHTTTYRKLVKLNDGGILVDTPGMKEVGLLEDVEGLDDTFRDIMELSKACKFSDCHHRTEPGCAIKEAINNKELSQERYASYVKLKREAAFMEKKLKLAEKKRESKTDRKSVV